MSPELKTKILATFNTLNDGLVGRESVIKVALLTVLAGENLLLIGPPGTAKSLIARRVAEALTPKNENNHYFEYLLTKFSTPEEIFGPLSITALKADCFKRNTAGYLPTVQIAFLDEIFKASSSILNALLTILNERIYHNGAEMQRVPLQALIAASNELPTGQDELSALYDRFLLRVFVDYVSLDSLPLLFEKTPDELSNLKPFTSNELTAITEAAEAVTIPSEIVQAIQQIWQKHREVFKEDRREQLSDRRLKKVIKLLRVAAATNGRDEVNLSDIVLLKDCLWNHPDNALKVHDMLLVILRDLSYLVAVENEQHNVDMDLEEKKPIKTKSVIKGYKGSGTQSDPILIGGFHDIEGFEREDVGQKGYYFRQTADIDCSALTTWPNIDFCGHYDGGGYTIKRDKWESLFSTIQPKSTVCNLNLQSLSLARKAYSSEVVACASNNSLIEVVDNCKIIACESGWNIVWNSATQCQIIRCQSVSSLIRNTAMACVIEDCFINLNLTHSHASDFNLGGIALSLTQGCIVKNCLVVGSLKRTEGVVLFSGIARVCDASTIESCVLGNFKQEGARNILEGRISKEIKEASTLKNNVALDSHKGTSDSKGADGKSLSVALYTQHYFEHTLDWNFDTVWQWNDAKNRPELQSVGVGAVVDAFKKASSNLTDDLLAQQMRANIWL